MKYDRPVRELLAECAASLPAPFTANDVLEWFHQHYPDIKATTIRTHISGLTDGDTASRRDYQFAHRTAVLERVGRGLYRPIEGRGALSAPERVRTLALASAPRPGHATADVVLVGCVKSKQDAPAPARELYTGALFERRRAYAEASGVPWFVVSSRWGLVAPDEWITPYDLYLGDQPADYRRAWGSFVVAQLARRRALRDAVVEIHAGDPYVDALTPPLAQWGAAVSDPVDARSFGETLSWYTAEPTPTADTTTDAVAEAVAALDDESRALTPAELRAQGTAALRSAGLYSWWVDVEGADELSRGIGHPVRPGLIYAGQAGATRWPSGQRSANTLADRLLGMHLGGRARMSTFRTTLASALQQGGVDEVRLSAWMELHLSVVVFSVEDAELLAGLEDAVLEALDPPLNLRGMRPTALRQRLTHLRRMTVTP